MVTDVSERTLGDPKYAATQGNIPTSVSNPVARTVGKKELGGQEIVLQNLLHDVDIQSIKLRKG